MDFIVETVLRPLFELVVWVLAYHVGRVVVAAVSFGRWRSERLLDATSKKRGFWRRIYLRREGRVHVTAEATALLGLVVCGVLAAVVAWWCLAR